jgi:chromate reductase
MTKLFEVALIIGSLRKASFTRKIAKAVLSKGPPELSARIVEIGDLVLYNEDFYSDPPASWKRAMAVDHRHADAPPDSH